ncbi:hypothetical protein KR059_000158 [Drosophila kikkawai]|nr:hypothetical protein KR059_000158 [Drosophila kikkawai]
MNKKQKSKKAAKVAANANAAAAKLQKSIGEEEEVACAESDGGASGSKPEMDRAYRKNLNKLINLADKLPNSLVLHHSNGEGDSSGSGKSTNDDDEAPELVNPNASKGGDDGQRYSRGEKKARRLLMKLDLKPVENVYRVTMKKSKNILLCIDKPDVYKSPTGTYIFFGKVYVEDLTNTATTQAAERYREVEAIKDKGADNVEAPDAAGSAPVDDDDDGSDGDEAAAQDLEERDIELVQMQASCSRKRAIKALLQNGQDVVNAIMDLTMG